MNIRAAFLHNLADAFASIEVIVAGAVILLYDWTLIDPLVTLMIAGYILWQSVFEVRGVIHVLMLGTPPQFDLDDLIDGVLGIDGVLELHHFHLWSVAEHQLSFEAHVVVRDSDWPGAESYRSAVSDSL